MKTFILLTTTLFLTSVFGHASECDFDMSGSYDCGEENGVLTISQNGENFEIQLPDRVTGFDQVIADNTKRTANFKDNARPVTYAASCRSLSPSLNYRMTASDGYLIRKVELTAIEQDVVLDVFIGKEGAGIGTRCSKI